MGGQAGASTYCEDFGLLGSNPRSLIKPDEAAMPVIRNSLNFGTTKGTGHIPGYQGFLSAAPHAGTARGERPHDRIHYHRNLVGYAGHVAESAQNEGRRQQSDLMEFNSSDGVHHSLSLRWVKPRGFPESRHWLDSPVG